MECGLFDATHATTFSPEAPTTQYCEAQGVTVSKLLELTVTTVKRAHALSYAGDDTLRLMATDGYGNFSRSWTYNELYGVNRYFFEGLYDQGTGWNTGWEVAGEDSSKFGMTLEDYNAHYALGDPYYENKRTVFEAGEETTVILATQSFSWRTTTDALVSSTEPGISSYVAAHGGAVAGCLETALTHEYALRLSLPMTELDLMAAHRTAYDNVKWIYSMQLETEKPPSIQFLGTVAEPI